MHPHPKPFSAPQQYSLIDTLVSSFQSTQDRNYFEHSMGDLQQLLYNMYAPGNYVQSSVHSQLYQEPLMKSVKLEIPKQNSLTDSLLKNTMGCQDNLAKSYVRILDQTQKKQDQARQKRILQAKKKFSQSNTHRDIFANTRPFMTSTRFAIQRPVIQNQHESYLKTQLIFLQQPKTPSANTQSYFDKHTDMIVKKINDMGGMQDTIGRMEGSLSKNQVKGFKKKQVLAGFSREKRWGSPTLNHKKSQGKLDDSWINKSREMRESFMAKLNIE